MSEVAQNCLFDGTACDAGDEAIEEEIIRDRHLMGDSPDVIREAARQADYHALVAPDASLGYGRLVSNDLIRRAWLMHYQSRQNLSEPRLNFCLDQCKN